MDHEWIQAGEGYGVGQTVGGQSGVGWTERCQVCYMERQMVRYPTGRKYEDSWIKTSPVCGGPAPAHVVAAVEELDRATKALFS